jgi:hypothetical protein
MYQTETVQRYHEIYSVIVLEYVVTMTVTAVEFVDAI